MRTVIGQVDIEMSAVAGERMTSDERYLFRDGSWDGLLVRARSLGDRHWSAEFVVRRSPGQLPIELIAVALEVVRRVDARSAGAKAPATGTQLELGAAIA